MTAPVSLQSVVEKTLAEHGYAGSSRPASPDHGCPLITLPHDGCGCARIVLACTGCDWFTEADGTQGDAHRAHVAAEVVTALADAGLLRRPVSGWASRFAPLPVEVVSDE